MKVLRTIALAAAQVPIISAQNSTTNSSAVIFQLSDDSQFSFTLQGVMALANGGGSATGEVLRAASQISPGDFESYFNEFKFLADAIHATGESSRYRVSQREAFFRSAAYYRAADFYLHGNWSDPRINSLWGSQLSDFDAAIALLPVPGQRFSIQADGFEVPVIFYSPQEPLASAPVKRSHCSQNKRPTLLVGSGYDGPQEDLYHNFGRFALERGWNFVTYEGPGQPTVRRQQNLGFRPDWWEVVTPVVDWLEARNDVDSSRLALQGVSFGGALAPIAASQDHRFAAVILNDGMYNFSIALEASFPTALMQVFKAGNQAIFDKYVLGALASYANITGTTDDGDVTKFRWGVEHGMWAFKTESPYQWLRDLEEYAITPAMFNNITSPVFVASGQDDNMATGQPEAVRDYLGDKAYYHSFETVLGAGEHCAIGAEPQFAQVTYDWLQGVFENLGNTTANGTVI